MSNTQKNPENLSDEELEKLYEKETGKNPIYRGSKTNAYLTWLESKFAQPQNDSKLIDKKSEGDSGKKITVKKTSVKSTKSTSKITNKKTTEPKIVQNLEEKVQPKPEQKSEQKPEQKIEVKQELKIQPKPEPKLEPKPVPKPEHKTEQKTELKQEIKTQSKPEEKKEINQDSLISKDIEDKRNPHSFKQRINQYFQNVKEFTSAFGRVEPIYHAYARVIPYLALFVQLAIIVNFFSNSNIWEAIGTDSNPIFTFEQAIVLLVLNSIFGAVGLLIVIYIKKGVANTILNQEYEKLTPILLVMNILFFITALWGGILLIPASALLFTSPYKKITLKRGGNKK